MLTGLRRVASPAVFARWSLLLVVACFALTGCSNSSEPSTVNAVTDAYREWDDSAIAGKGEVACSRMTERFVKFSIEDAQSKAKNCAELMKETAVFAKKHPEIKNYKLSNVVVNGDRATLTDRTPFDDVVDTARMSMVKEGGRWKVDTQVIVEQDSPAIPPIDGVET